ncbi:MAG: hypothetical protein MIO90_00535 [Methanomassiliicoccales archaeon]|nr:hypothetical protein [Methanomassiliicoccales archaeon]
MNDAGGTLMNVAISTAVRDLNKMKRMVNYSLLFSTLLLMVTAIDAVLLLLTGRSYSEPEDILVLVPPPMLIFPLAIYAIFQVRLMGRIGKGLRSLETDLPLEDRPIMPGKSLTDLHYEMVGNIDRALRIWPLMMFFFVLYFIFWAVALVGWLLLGVFPALKLTFFTSLNILIVPLALVYFTMQTRQWFRRRRKLRELEDLERAILEELKI